MSEYGAIIRAKAAKYGFAPELLASLILQESSGDRFAYRYEGGFYAKYLERTPRERMLGRVPAGKMEGEKRFRSVSWGLTQILGETARELGFEGLYLTELLQPELNIEYGSKYLSQCLKRAKGDVYAALQYYNGGGDLSYAPSVLARLEKQEWKVIL